MNTNQLYRLIILSSAGVEVGILEDYQSFSFGEKRNGFINCELNINANNLPTWVLENFKTGCGILIKRKINNDYKTIWGGILSNKKDWEVNNINVRTQKAVFKHFGQDYFDNVPYFKNVTYPTDEGTVLSDIILYGQNPDNWNAIDAGLAITTSEADYGVTIGTVELTGNLITQDFSQKLVTVGKAIDQIIEAKDPLNKRKMFLVSPSINKNTLRQFYFWKDYTSNVKAYFNGVSSTTLTNFTKQNIVKIKTTAPDNKNVIIGKGEALTKTARSTTISGYLLRNKARFEEESFKNVADGSVLQDLTDKSLSKLENPERLIEVEIMSNDPQIGNFGAGDIVRIDYKCTDDTAETVFGDYTVYELTLSVDNLGRETAKMKLATSDPAELERGNQKLIMIIKQTQNRLQLLEQN